MFGVLRKAFVPDLPKTETTAAEPGNPNFIKDPQKIIKLLQQIIESPPLCSVTVRNLNKTFFTSILEIQPENQLIIIDELTPASGNNLLNQHGELKLFTFINGLHLTFRLNGVTREQSGNQIVYKALLPETIYYPQRRSSPRIKADLTAIDFQGTSRDSGLLIKGIVSDLSRTGLCITLAKSGNDILYGDKLTNCLMLLPDGSTFSFDLSVRSIRKHGRSDLQKQIGGHFNGLSPQNQHKLDRTICALERQQIRKRKN